MANYDDMKDLIMSAKGQFCSVTFVKKDGTRRVMTIQPAKLKFEVKGADGSESHQRGAETRAVAHPNLFPVWSVDAKAVRSVNLDTVESIKLGKKYHEFTF